MAREKRDTIQILALNLSRQPVTLQATYVVYALDEKGNKGNEVCRRTVGTYQSFIPEDILALTPGRYRMEASVLDGQGRTCTGGTGLLFSLARPLTPPGIYSTGMVLSGWGRKLDAPHPDNPTIPGEVCRQVSVCQMKKRNKVPVRRTGSFPAPFKDWSLQFCTVSIVSSGINVLI